ncbi:MAG: Signal peptidase, partial [Modestobacter sp.]|nr:Signal peptidase [Modestobacter sp.]
MAEQSVSGAGTPDDDPDLVNHGASTTEPGPAGAEPAASIAGPASAASAAAETDDHGRTWYGRRRRKPRKPRRKAPWWELTALVLLAVGIAILVKSFVVQPFFIPSESM